MDIAPRCSLSARSAKVLGQVMSGRSDANIPFKKLRNLLLNLGFEERVGRGSHHKFCIAGLPRPLNLQQDRGGKCKPYEVGQVRETLGAMLSANSDIAAA